MLGNPKYTYGDVVEFKNKKGMVFIVDAYGVFADPSEVHYDIMVFRKNKVPFLFKHIRENFIKRKLKGGTYMQDKDLLEVQFHRYCGKCKYKDLNENKDPCNECLDYGFNENSHKPVKFESIKKK